MSEKCLKFRFVLLVISILWIDKTSGNMLAERSVKLNGRIVGGTLANIKDFPYQLSLQYHSEHICGAAILSAKYAVTAAHCVQGGIIKFYSIYGGSSNLNNAGQTVQVESIIPHQNYNQNTSDYDIAIIKFCCELRLGPGINAVQLPVQNQIFPVNTGVSVSGWGYKREGGITQNKLRKVAIPIIDWRKCQALYIKKGPVTERMLCAGSTRGGKDACQGDSGGPLVSNKVLVGIVSWGYGCARPGYPGVYTKVATFRDWIREKSGI